MKKLLYLIAAAVMVWNTSSVAFGASISMGNANIQVTGYDPEVDYMALMEAAAEDGSVFAVEMGRIYEAQRNMKIDDLHLEFEKTSYFLDNNTAAEIREAMAAARRWWTEEELDLLARLVNQEMGSGWIPDRIQQLTASVVLNRVKSGNWPNTIREVIYQPGQYGPAWTGAIETPAPERVQENCRKALEGWPLFPEGVVYQSGTVQGAVYETWHDPAGYVEYFCY